MLESISLRGLLSFGWERVTLPLTRLNVLIGPNASGKSNVLDALSLLAEIPHDARKYLNSRGGGDQWMHRGPGGDGIAEIEVVAHSADWPRAVRYAAQLEVREGRLETVAVPVAEFISRVLHHFELLRPAVRVDAGDGGRSVRALLPVSRQLEQAILNFLNNAADVSPQDVAMQVSASDGRVVMDVMDRGPGFSPAILRQAGNRIVGTPEDETGGMGIGLLLSNATIEGQGGVVRVSVREGGGSLVRVILPVLRETVDE